MKMAVVVQGRFHAFDLARALLARGHDVWLFTNYPGWAVERFGFPAERVYSCAWHGLLVRAFSRVERFTGLKLGEALLHRLFGIWAAWMVPRQHWDVVHLWSGVSEELLRRLAGSGTPTWLLRGSAHIRTQSELLQAEERRSGVKLDKPSRWMIAREEREYRLASQLRLLSRFSEKTFLDHGFDPKRLVCIPLAARRAQFRPELEVIEARTQRILAGRPLRVLFVGSLLFRKGLLDLLEIGRRLPRERFECRMVGALTAESEHVMRELKQHWQVLGARPQSELPRQYAWGDIFVFPTIEDGFAVVVAQAQVSGLPIIATTNCAAPDLLEQGRTGWVVPIRSPQSFVDRLLWADQHRAELARMVQYTHAEFQQRDWADVAAEFEQL